MPPQLQQALVLDYNADSTEFCPWRCCPLSRELLAVGTYQLEEATQQRIGRLYLFALQGTTGASAQDLHHAAAAQGAASAAELPQLPDAEQRDPYPRWTLNPRQQIDLPGIFDLKWSPATHGHGHTHSHGLLGAALADGTLRLFALAPEAVLEPHQGEAAQSPAEAAVQLMEEQSRCQACTEGMALSLDWQPSSSGSSEASACLQHLTDDGGGCAAAAAWTGRVAVSSSSGSLSIIQVSGSQCEVSMEWQAHDLEVWCVAFSRTEVVYSGADDSCFKAWDLRDTDSPAFSNRRAHSAGVCTISPHPHLPHVLATGSYDEQVRLWDVRQPCRPLMTAQVGTGGGNWRLRWHPTDPSLLLAACMYNGFAILRAGPGSEVPVAECTGSLGPLEQCAAEGVEDQQVQSGRDCVLSSLEVETTYTAHGSIAYGADWYQHPTWKLPGSWLDAQGASDGAGAGVVHPGSHAQEAGDVGSAQGCARLEGPKSDLVATCSFYDRLLHLWQP